MSQLSETPIANDVTSGITGVKLALHIHRVKFLLIRYWWIVAATMVIGAAIQGYRASQIKPEYASSSRMMVSGQINLSQNSVYSEDVMNFFGTQLALMKSPDTVKEAMARVGAIHPEVALDPDAKVDASQEPKTSIFDLHVTSGNPEFAPLLLQAVMDTYLASKRGRKEQTTNGAVLAITSEIGHLDSEIRSDEQELLDFQKENNVVFIEEQSNSAAAYLVGLNNELARLTKEHDLLSLERSERPAANGSFNSSDATTSADPGSNNSSPASVNASIQAQQESIDKLKILRDDYSTYLKDMHPKMIALSDAIDKEQKFLDVLKNKSIEEREAHEQDLELQIQNLEKQIADWNKKSLDLNQRLGTFQLLKSKITREQTMYNQLASSVQNVNVNNSIDQEDVIILDQASSSSLVPVNYQLQMMYGALFGLLAGAGILHLINRLDDRVNSPMMLEGVYDFPTIGQIPLSIPDKKSKGKRVPLLAKNDMRHILVESYRGIRSSILFRSTVKIPPKSLLICGSAPGEGKSTLAANLAITFAFAGASTLLVDADLRKGLLHDLFETSVSPGLSDYLREQISWREAVQTTRFPGLDLLPRGKVPQHAGELLLSKLVDILLQESAAEYDIVLWDSAPLLAVDDTANLCSRVDGAIFLVRINHTSIRTMISAVDILAQRNTKVFGLVINAVEPNQPTHYARYRYKEYYATEAEV